MNDKKKLSAKKYLSQIEMIDTKIQQKLEELGQLKQMMLNAGGIDYSKERVQTSKTGDALQKQVCNYVAMYQQINEEIDKFVDIKHQITLEIQGLDDSNQMKVLFKVYVQFKNLKEAAAEIGISYPYTRDVHKKALAAFEEKYKNLHYLS